MGKENFALCICHKIDRSCILCFKDSIEKVMCWKDRIDQLVQLIRWCGFGCMYVNDDLFCDLECLEERKQVRRTTYLFSNSLQMYLVSLAISWSYWSINVVKIWLYVLWLLCSFIFHVACSAIRWVGRLIISGITHKGIIKNIFKISWWSMQRDFIWRWWAVSREICSNLCNLQFDISLRQRCVWVWMDTNEWQVASCTF